MTKKILLPSALFIAAVSTASAADLSPAVYSKAPPAPVMFSWTGIYVGLNVGGKWATTDGRVDVGAVTGAAAVTFPLGSATDSTVIGGGQIGYNWQSGAWVFGLEGDIDAQKWSMTRATAPVGVVVPGTSFSIESTWQASVRGRIGYAWDRTLLYATGGLALTQAKVGTMFGPFLAADQQVPGSSASDVQTLLGGTVGAGLEYAYTNNISLGIEGRYTWYGENVFDGGVIPRAFVPPGVFVVAPVTQRINLNTAEVMGKINFKFW